MNNLNSSPVYYPPLPLHEQIRRPTPDWAKRFLITEELEPREKQDNSKERVTSVLKAVAGKNIWFTLEELKAKTGANLRPLQHTLTVSLKDNVIRRRRVAKNNALRFEYRWRVASDSVEAPEILTIRKRILDELGRSPWQTCRELAEKIKGQTRRKIQDKILREVQGGTVKVRINNNRIAQGNGKPYHEYALQ